MRKMAKITGLLMLGFLVFAAIFAGARIHAASLFGDTAEDWVVKFYQWSIPIGSGLAVVMIVLGGYKYMTSQGNAEALGEAKEMIYGAIAGLVLLLLIALIYNALISAPITK